MSNPKYDPTPMTPRQMAVEMAFAIVDMHQELSELRRYKLMYDELLAEHNELIVGNIRHNQDMMHGLLQVAMTPGVLESMADANEAKEQA